MVWGKTQYIVEAINLTIHITILYSGQHFVYSNKWISKKDNDFLVQNNPICKISRVLEYCSCIKQAFHIQYTHVCCRAPYWQRKKAKLVLLNRRGEVMKFPWHTQYVWSGGCHLLTDPKCQTCLFFLVSKFGLGRKNNRIWSDTTQFMLFQIVLFLFQQHWVTSNNRSMVGSTPGYHFGFAVTL